MEVGVDIEEIDRIKKTHKKWSDRFLNRIFTKKELNYCFSKKDPYPSLCGKFCAKEAIIKVFDGKMYFGDIEVINRKSGKPSVFIKGRKSDVQISISHSRKYAAAVAIKP